MQDQSDKRRNNQNIHTVVIHTILSLGLLKSADSDFLLFPITLLLLYSIVFVEDKEKETEKREFQEIGVSPLTALSLLPTICLATKAAILDCGVDQVFPYFACVN